MVTWATTFSIHEAAPLKAMPSVGKGEFMFLSTSLTAALSPLCGEECHVWACTSNTRAVLGKETHTLTRTERHARPLGTLRHDSGRPAHNASMPPFVALSHSVHRCLRRLAMMTAAIAPLPTLLRPAPCRCNTRGCQWAGPCGWDVLGTSVRRNRNPLPAGTNRIPCNDSAEGAESKVLRAASSGWDVGGSRFLRTSTA